MIGRTNGGSGVGGISSNSALLVVYTPLGSTVTATNGGTTKTLRTGIALSDDPTREMHLISIGTAQFGTWTVTATLGDKVSSDTIIIDAAKEYNIDLHPFLPAGYQAVEYIANTNQQWINFDVEPDVTFRVKLLAATSNLTDEGLFGVDALSSAGANGYRSELMMVNNHYNLYSRGDSSPTNAEINHTVTVNELVDMEYEQGSNRQKLTIYGLTVTASEKTVKRYSCGLFSFLGTNSRYYHRGRARHAEIYNDGVLVRDMWACYRISDSVAGMYDLVSQSFFVNAGSGTFSVGGDLK